MNDCKLDVDPLLATVNCDVRTNHHGQNVMAFNWNLKHCTSQPIKLLFGHFVENRLDQLFCNSKRCSILDWSPSIL